MLSCSFCSAIKKNKQAVTSLSENPEVSSGGPPNVPVVPTSIAVDASSDRMTIAGSHK